MKSSGKKIIENIKELGHSVEILEHDSLITIDDVVRTLNISINKMAKTILLMEKNAGLIAIVLPGTNKVDCAKVANILHVSKSSIQLASRACMIDFGVNPGDVCPFHDFLQRVIVDAVLLKQRNIYCGSGDPRKTIVINPEEMVKITKATIADVSQTKGGSNE